MRSFKLIELKRPPRRIVPDKGFFERHSHSYGVRKRQNLGQKDHFAVNYRKFKRPHYPFVTNRIILFIFVKIKINRNVKNLVLMSMVVLSLLVCKENKKNTIEKKWSDALKFD